MIQCPHCEKGMLWGIYLDVPPEMKEGVAEWMACEPPEASEEVTCPACEQVAGTYEELFKADAEGRREEKAKSVQEHLSKLSQQELPEFYVLGAEFTGSFHREKFFQDAWTQFDVWLQELKKEGVLPPTLFRDIPDSLPKAIGVRLDHPSTTNPIRCRYLAGIVINGQYADKLRERLAHRQYNDPKSAQILYIPAQTYVHFPFAGSVKEFFEMDKTIFKQWYPEHQMQIPENHPCLEFYSDRLESWPPPVDTLEAFQAEYLMPVEKMIVEQPSGESHETPNAPTPSA